MKKQTQAVAVTSFAVVLLVMFWLLRTRSVLLDEITAKIASSSAWVESSAMVVAHATSPVVLICVALFAAFLAIETHHMYAWLHIAAALVITFGISWLLKEITQLPRPANAQLVAPGLSEYAFPSTHAASASTLAVLAGFHVRRLTKLDSTTIYLPISISVVAIGVSRIVLRAHTVSDVLAGLVLGVSLGLLAAMMWSRWSKFLHRQNEHR